MTTGSVSNLPGLAQVVASRSQRATFRDCPSGGSQAASPSCLCQGARDFRFLDPRLSQRAGAAMRLHICFVVLLFFADNASGAITADAVVNYNSPTYRSSYWGAPYNNPNAALGLPNP